MKNKKMIALVTAIIAVVALFTGLLVACNNNKALMDVTSADWSGNVVANYGKGYSLYNKKNKQVIKEFYDYMEIANEGYLLASNKEDKGVSLLDYSGKMLVSGVDNDYQIYDFEMNYETTSEITDAVEPTLKSGKSSVAYITARDSKGVDTLFAPNGTQIARLENTADTQISFETNETTNRVESGTTVTLTSKMLSLAVISEKEIEDFETGRTYSETTITIYDSSFKSVYSLTNEYLSYEVIEDGNNFAYVVEYEVADENYIDIVTKDGKILTYCEINFENITTSYFSSLIATQQVGASNSEIHNVLTGKTLTVNGSVFRINEIDDNYAMIIFSDYSTQIIDVNSMSAKLNLSSASGSLLKRNEYFYSSNDAVYDTNFNKIDGVVGFVSTLCNENSNVLSLLKKTDDTYVLYKNGDRVAEVPSSISYNSTTKLISYINTSNIRQYAHLSAPNKSLYNESNLPSTTGRYSNELNWFIIDNTTYFYNANSIISINNGSYKPNGISSTTAIYNNNYGALYSVRLTSTDIGLKDQYKLLLVTRNYIKEVANGETRFTVTPSYDNEKITIKNNEQCLYGDVILTDGCLDFKLKDYSNIKNIVRITDKYVVTENPNTNLNAVYLDGKMILPAIYHITEINGDYAVYSDNFNKRIYGLIKLEKNSYKVIEKAKYNNISFISDDYIAFTETKNGDPSISLKNIKKNKFVFKNAYSTTNIYIADPSVVNTEDKIEIPIAYTEKKGGKTKLVRIEVSVDYLY